MAVEVGQSAPDFTLYDTDRNQRSLSEFRGKNVVLAFFPGAFTGACTNEMCTFRDQLGQYEGMNAQVIGITVDPPFAQKAWCDANNVTYPFLSDYAREVTNLYDLAFPNLAGLQGYVACNRAVIIVDGAGVVRFTWTAPSPPTEPDYDEVRSAVAALG